MYILLHVNFNGRKVWGFVACSCADKSGKWYAVGRIPTISQIFHNCIATIAACPQSRNSPSPRKGQSLLADRSSLLHVHWLALVLRVKSGFGVAAGFERNSEHHETLGSCTYH